MRETNGKQIDADLQDCLSWAAKNFDALLEPEISLGYDVGCWFEAVESKPLKEHPLDGTRRFNATTNMETRRLILGKVETSGGHAAVLGKFTRTMFARDLHRQPEPLGENRA